MSRSDGERPGGEDGGAASKELLASPAMLPLDLARLKLPHGARQLWGTKDRPEKQTFHGDKVWTHAKDGKITVTPRELTPRLSKKPSSEVARV